VVPKTVVVRASGPWRCRGDVYHHESITKVDPLVKTPIFKKTFRWCRRGKIGQSSVDRRRSAVNCRFQRCSAPLWDGSRRKDAVSRRSWGLERRRRPQLGPGGPRSA
jgi:hypothetical protein